MSQDTCWSHEGLGVAYRGKFSESLNLFDSREALCETLSSLHNGVAQELRKNRFTLNHRDSLLDA